MKRLTTTTAALILGLLVSGAFAPTWSASFPTDEISVAEASSANTAMQTTSIFGNSQFTRTDNRTAAKSNCKPGHRYSAHNIVGHPQACIMGTISGIGGVKSTIAGVPAL